MLTEISAGLSSLQAITSIVKGLEAAKTRVAINEIKIGLQEHILKAHEALGAAQVSEAAAAKRISDLEAEVMRLKNWEGEKERYELHAIDGGTFAYVPKLGMESGEPPHWLCANCFNRHVKSFLQFKGQDQRPGGGRGDESTYGCDTCKASMKVGYTKSPSKRSPAPQATALGPGKECPSCGRPEYRVAKSEPAKGPMGDLGLIQRTHHCGACGFEETASVVPK